MKNYDSLEKGLNKHLKSHNSGFGLVVCVQPTHDILLTMHDKLALLKLSFFTPYLSVLGALGQAGFDASKKNVFKI